MSKEGISPDEVSGEGKRQGEAIHSVRKRNGSNLHIDVDVSSSQHRLAYASNDFNTVIRMEGND